MSKPVTYIRIAFCLSLIFGLVQSQPSNTRAISEGFPLEYDQEETLTETEINRFDSNKQDHSGGVDFGILNEADSLLNLSFRTLQFQNLGVFVKCVGISLFLLFCCLKIAL